MEFHSSAHKHGVGEDDIPHAIEHAMVVAESEPDKVLYLGPDGAGNLLEVVTLLLGDGGELVIHAMPMRKQYEWLLPGEADG